MTKHDILFWLLAACLFWMAILVPCGAVFIWRTRRRLRREFDDDVKGIEERIRQRDVWLNRPK